MTTIVRHRQRGTTYTIIGRATAQASTTPILEGQKVMVYRGEARFVPVAATDTAKGREADARGDMGPGDRAGGTPPIQDWTVEDSRTAREILSYLGIFSAASLEPGADRRRDKVAAIICAAREGASHG